MEALAFGQDNTYILAGDGGSAEILGIEQDLTNVFEPF